jgi:hypothetical protein
VCLDANAWLALHAYAKKLGKKRSAILRDALERWFQWVERRGGNVDEMPRRRLVAVLEPTQRPRR